MRVFTAEVGKVLRSRGWLVAIFVGAVFFWVQGAFLLQHFPNGEPFTTEHRLILAWHEEFGPTLEPDEWQELDARRQGLERQADSMIAQEPTFTRAGISSWAELQSSAIQDDAVDQKQWELLFGPEGIGWSLQVLENTGDRYSLGASGLAGFLRGDRDEENASAAWRSLMSPELVTLSRDYALVLTQLAFVAVLLGVGPLIAQDRATRIWPQQAAAAVGRGILTRQAAAMATVGALVSVAVTAIGVLPLRDLGYRQLWSTSATSFLTGLVYRQNTLGELCGVLATQVLLGGLLAALMAFALSVASRSITSLGLWITGALVLVLPAMQRVLPASLTWSVALPGPGPIWVLGVPVLVVAAADAIILLRARQHDI